MPIGNMSAAKIHHSGGPADTTNSLKHLVNATHVASVMLAQTKQITPEILAPVFDAIKKFDCGEVGLMEPWHWTARKGEFLNSSNSLLSSKPPGLYYFHIAETSNFSIGIFIIPPGAQLPTHDHPKMSVISKVLFGSTKVKAYNWKNGVGDQVRGGPVSIHHDEILLNKGDIEYLLPDSGNIHRFSCIVNDEKVAQESNCENMLGCAVLDVILPPYNDNEGRHCVYYKEIVDANLGLCLKPVEPPEDFFVENLN